MFSSPDAISKIPREHTMMQNERRFGLRKPVQRLVYISLPINNGGVVLDVSEGGVSFHSIAPVKADGPIHFQFAVDSARRINAVGELAWTDETGKTGGLRFTELPDDVREHIRAWLGRTKASVPNILPVAEPVIGADVAPNSEVGLAPVVATEDPLFYDLKPPVYSTSSYELSMFSVAPKSEAWATAAVPQGSFPSRHPIAALVLTIFLASVVGSGIFAYVTTSQAGDALYNWGEKAWDGFHSQPMSKSLAPPANSALRSSKISQQ